MSNSLLYTLNTNTQALAIGSQIDLGSIVRRYGQNINLSGDSILVKGGGYYNVSADVTITGTTAGTTTVNLVKDGTVIASSPVTVAVGAVVTIPVQAVVREIGCCRDNTSNLTFVLTGTAETVNQISVVVEKI